MEKLCTSPKATLASTGSVHTVTPQPSRARDGGHPAKRKTQGSSITLLVAGNVSLAEPDVLECDPMKKAEKGSQRALESSTQASTLTCAPSPQAPGLSPHRAKVRGWAGSVPPSCWSHTQRGPESAPRAVPRASTCTFRRRGAQGLWSEVTYTPTLALAVMGTGR